MDLSPFAFFTTLSQEARHFLHNAATPIALEAHTILFYQGDICDNVLLLTKGEVKLYLQSDDADEITLYTLKAGEQCIINTSSLLSQTQASGTAQSVTPIEGYLLNEEDVKTLMKLSDAYQRFIFSLYTVRMQSLATLIEDIKFKRLDDRILKWLQQQTQNPVTITHETLAEALGSSRVVISRVLKELERKKRVILHRGKIEVLG